MGLAPPQQFLRAEQGRHAHTNPTLGSHSGHLQPCHGQLSGSTSALDRGVTSTSQTIAAAGTDRTGQLRAVWTPYAPTVPKEGCCV